MKAICKHCGIEFEKSAGHLNRANKSGLPVFCSKQHFYDSRKIERSHEEKKAIKAAYDKANILKPEIKAKRKSYNETPKGREAQKRRRKTRMPKHIEYCRQPEYKANKVDYDREFRAKKQYGEFWESAILAEKIESKIIQMADKADLRTIQGTNNKSKKRKRQWLKLLKILPQLT